MRPNLIFRPFVSFVIILVGLFGPSLAMGQAGKFSLSLDAIGAVPSLNLPSGPNHGIGLQGTLDYRFSDFYGGGLSLGMVEFVSPKGREDMKTVWLDIMERFFPFPTTATGEAYFQFDFGFSPYPGLFTDYWQNYAAANIGPAYAEPPGTIFWNAQASVGYFFTLDKDWSLDTGIQYGVYGPPWVGALRTLGLKAGLAWSFDLDRAHGL